MQTELADFIRDTPQGRQAETILRACVHCGFCTATCPTYQLLGDELDGPRGRIYQIKQLLEGAAPGPGLYRHLDRCLVCRACETTCPSGVNYHHLLDIGREQLEGMRPRPWRQRWGRKAMLTLFSTPALFSPLMKLARLCRPFVPVKLRHKILPQAPLIRPVKLPTQRRMLLLEGCVQPTLAPQINQAAKKILAHFGIELVTLPQVACCGALPQHLSAPQRARTLARQNIDAWHDHLMHGAEAIVSTASGCGAQIRDYANLLRDEPGYAEKAAWIADQAKDLIEIVTKEQIESLPLTARNTRIAVHTPCTLQHALRAGGAVEQVLRRLGYTLCEVAEGHLCCGSAGTYSLTQPSIANQLRERKLQALTIHQPEQIVTANIGCLGHLQNDQGAPVIHWINLIEQDLNERPSLCTV
jgi:glycolate oxidase iron-sulfur subunit